VDWTSSSRGRMSAPRTAASSAAAFALLPARSRIEAYTTWPAAPRASAVIRPNPLDEPVMRTIFSVMVLSPVEPHSGDRMSLTESYKRLGRPRGGMTAARDRLAAAATPDALGRLYRPVLRGQPAKQVMGARSPPS